MQLSFCANDNAAWYLQATHAFHLVVSSKRILVRCCVCDTVAFYIAACATNPAALSCTVVRTPPTKRACSRGT